jgi:vancomycin aglycone glucosyltransferase
VSRGWAELAPGDAGADCLAVGDVNHQALFPRVAAVVHHGGAGTTTAAARAGTPQVVAPQHYDQHYCAGRVRELGIGAADASAPTAASLTAALSRALAPEIAARSRALAAVITGDGARRGRAHRRPRAVTATAAPATRSRCCPPRSTAAG